MWFSQGGIELNGSLSRGPRLRRSFGGRDYSTIKKEEVRFSYPAVCFRIIRIFRDRVIELAQGVLQAFWRAFCQIKSRLHIGFVSGTIFGRVRRNLLSFLLRQQI